MNFIRLLAITGLAIGFVNAQTGAGGQSPEAAAVLDRYVEVTGGAARYKKVNAAVWEVTLTPPNGPTTHATIFQARDGREQEELETSGKVQERGVTNGVAWEYADATGALILSGKESDRRIAAANTFLDDDWRRQFPEAAFVGEENVNGHLCSHVRLVRKDGAVRDRFYDKENGLLRREIVRDGENAPPDILTIETYVDFSGFTYKAKLQSEKAGQISRLKVESAQFSAKPPPDAFVVPEKVLRALAARKSPSGIPSAIDLLERFVAQTGGKKGYAAIKTQKMTADITFAMAGLKGKLLTYEAPGGKLYTSFDLPGAGKFESGSDGTTAWERSVLLGPRIVPRSEGSRGMLGPGPDQIMNWFRAYETVETVGKEEANGSPCWSVRMIARGSEEPAETMCFDVETGYLSRLTGTSKTQMGTVAMDLTMSNYQNDGGVKSPHHLQTHVSGQDLNIDITEVVVNGPTPDGTFDLPAEIKALKEKKITAAEKQGDISPERPSLRRRK